MSGRYTFTIEPARDLVRIELAGFFTADQVAAFDRDRRRLYGQLRCGPNAHVAIVDMRAADIQAQDVVTAFAASIDDPSTAARKLAFVMSRSLARLQVKRAAAGREAAYFHTVEEAEEWLFADVEAVAA